MHAREEFDIQQREQPSRPKSNYVEEFAEVAVVVSKQHNHQKKQHNMSKIDNTNNNDVKP